MAQWSTEDVVGLVSHGARFLAEMVRTWRSPEVTLKRIIDRTQELKDSRRAIDEDLREKYEKKESSDGSADGSSS